MASMAWSPAVANPGRDPLVCAHLLAHSYSSPVTGSSHLVGSLPSAGGFEHGQVAHERVGGGAVPVLVGRADDGLTGVDAHHGSVAGADQTDALGHVQCLPDGVRVPIGVAPGVNRTSLTFIRDGPVPL
jgi:hypothetical protein